jgi:hypothetical protein
MPCRPWLPSLRCIVKNGAPRPGHERGNSDPVFEASVIESKGYGVLDTCLAADCGQYPRGERRSKHMVALRGQMLAIGLVGQSTQHAVCEYDHPDVSGSEAALNVRCAIRPPLTSIVTAGMQDDDPRPVWYRLIQTSQHPFRGVAVNPRVHHLGIRSFRPQYCLELSRIGLIALHALAISIACTERYDRCGISGRNAECQYGQQCQASASPEPKSARFHACPHDQTNDFSGLRHLRCQACRLRGVSQPSSQNAV